MRRFSTFMSIVMVAGAIFASMSVSAYAEAQASTPVSTGSVEYLRSATEWLMSQQADDGGFAGFSGESEPSITIDAVLALVAAAKKGVDVGTSIDDAIGFLESGDEVLVYSQTGTGPSAKLVLGMVASGGSPSDIASVNPLALVEFGLNRETGVYGAGIYDHALAMLALAATDSDVPEEAIVALEDSQTPEGGWSFDGAIAEGAADSNTTAMVVQALVAIGERDSELVTDALGYLLTTLIGDSGATFQPGESAIADSNSTALVLQAVLAAGDDPSSDAWGDLPSALAKFQNESGAFHYNAEDPSDNLFSTVQAIVALAGETLPVTTEADVATPVTNMDAHRSSLLAVKAA